MRQVQGKSLLQKYLSEIKIFKIFEIIFWKYKFHFTSQ